MPFGIFGARFDVQEFILGLILGFLLYTLVRRSKPAFLTFLEWFRNRGEAVIESFTSSSEEPYFQELHFNLDRLHLANPLFPFREIIIPPRILLPTEATDPLSEEQSEELYPTILPTLPDWKALESVYQSPTLPITHLLDSGENVLITGDLGTGKTSALIYLAYQCAARISKDPKGNHKLPIFLHAADLDLSRRATKDPLTVIVETIRKTSSIGLVGFLTRYLRLHLQDSPALVLLDGLDELTDEEILPVQHWLGQLRSKYPQHQVIAACAPRGYNGIFKVGLFPVSIAPWSNYDLDVYLNKWTNAWQTHVVPILPKDHVGEIDPVLINSWLRVARVGYNPLEVTVKTWSFYVGDTQGPSLENALQAYIKRILSPNEQHAAQAIAYLWIRSRESTLAPSAIDKRLPLQDLINANILLKQYNERLRFSNPNIGTFLAAGGMLLARKISFNPQDNWEPCRAALRTFAAIGDASNLVDRNLKTTDDQLASSLLACASWLPRSKPDVPWRNRVLSLLAKNIQDDLRPYGLRLRILHALIASNEQPAKALFKRLLQSNSTDSRVLGIIGMGGLRNHECINDLQLLVQNESNQKIRFAACIALAAIGNTEALEVLGKFLLSGDDTSQLCASQALASHPGEGVPMLKEALEMKDVRVRRAAVFGLGRAQSDEVIQILEKVQLEDSQAIVKNAATDILENRRSPKVKLSFPAEDIASLSWLIAYAAESGFGVTPGKGALEMLRRVLVSGNQLQKIAALETVGFFHASDLSLETTQALKAEDSLIRHAAYEALWRLKAPKTLMSSVKEKQQAPA
jgi:HEAT repeat protein